MHLVDDEYLVSVAHRQNTEPGDDHLADVVDLGVRGGVDLQHVDVAPFGDLDTRVTLAAWLSGRTVDAVERAGENACRRRLPDASRSGKDERVRQPSAAQRVAKRTRDGLLFDDVVELLRTPLARDHLIGHVKFQISACRFQNFRFRMFRIAESDRDVADSTAAREACGTCQYPLSAAAFRP